ncbi:hypothetical protein IB75_03135 [Nitrosococcus oceani C-27]|uniref:Uncharacterized protein n=1 Tax=Nitrosococcus oceani C-27 TaxID=314279 RepID=A0A0E2Z5B0_9GAMM|nr:hypothetical protein IB75_03135 [Nitrosococcus oceani C-27]KFI23581.1 hypothetical protein HW44_03140 [Nitrosococcus oceani]
MMTLPAELVEFMDGVALVLGLDLRLMAIPMKLTMAVGTASPAPSYSSMDDWIARKFRTSPAASGQWH